MDQEEGISFGRIARTVMYGCVAGASLAVLIGADSEPFRIFMSPETIEWYRQARESHPTSVYLTSVIDGIPLGAASGAVVGMIRELLLHYSRERDEE